MNQTDISNSNSPKSIASDMLAGLIVFLVAVPLCLGIAVASGAPAISGLIAGIVGGIVVGLISGSQTSVSGPAAGLTAVVLSQINSLGAFQTFLLAVVLAGVLQILLGVFKAGALSAFFPSSVIKGLLAAIGVILLLKQLPHLLGHDDDPMGESAFQQPDKETTFSEFYKSIAEVCRGEIVWGALTVGLISLLFLIVWDRIKPLKKSLVPAPLLVVILGVLLGQLFSQWGKSWEINGDHLVKVPMIAETNPDDSAPLSTFEKYLEFLVFPDWSQWLNPAVYIAALTLAIVASLETLLNLDAVDKLDKKQRISPPNRELVAQGFGNIVSGLIGGIPLTSVIIRSSVNVQSGAETKLSAIFHGLLILGCVILIPQYLNMIPMSCLAAILLMTGFKLASINLFRQMWSGGFHQFVPFILTLVAIVFTDLLIGILIGLAVALVFVLYSNLKRPIRRIHEKHIDGDLLHIELANQVSFLNRASLESALREAPRGSRILIDARRTDYIDPDILSLIRDYKNSTAPVYQQKVSLVGFRDRYPLLKDTTEDVDFSRQEAREQLTPQQVIEILREGNKRFHEGHPLSRIFRQTSSEAASMSPGKGSAIATIFTGIDSEIPVEIAFDLDVGDAIVIRAPGKLVDGQVVGAMEYSVIREGVKAIVVLGVRNSAILNLAGQCIQSQALSREWNACTNLRNIMDDLVATVEMTGFEKSTLPSAERLSDASDQVVKRYVALSIERIRKSSPYISEAVQSGKIALVGAVYDSQTRKVEFLK